MKKLTDEEIYDCWVDADPTEYLPEMREKDGSINTELITFVELIQERQRKKDEQEHRERERND